MIEVLLSGIQTSFQDLGRFGYRHYGIPISGAMDQFSAKRANHLVGNSENVALIECLLQGPILKFGMPATIVICGADFKPTLNQLEISLNEQILIKKGDVLKMGSAISGNYGYIAIAGGFDTKEKFGSASYYDAILSENKIVKGDILNIKLPNQALDKTIIANSIPNNQTLIVSPGPEFNEIQMNILFDTNLTISNEISRMGFKLKSNKTLFAPEIITSPVQPGTVQLTPSGQLIVLMRDAQTTGGYARILQLDEISISHLAQKRIGEFIKFSTKNQ